MLIACYEKKSKNEQNELYKKESELISLLKFYNVPTDNAVVVLMPASKCESCKLGALKPLQSIDELFILAIDSNLQFRSKISQKCIVYNAEFVQKRRLNKLYPELFTIKNQKVIKYKALIN